MRHNQLQITSNFGEAAKVEMDRIIKKKKKIAKIVSSKTRGTMTSSKAQWYEFD